MQELLSIPKLTYSVLLHYLSQVERGNFHIFLLHFESLEDIPLSKSHVQQLYVTSVRRMYFFIFFYLSALYTLGKKWDHVVC